MVRIFAYVNDLIVLTIMEHLFGEIDLDDDGIATVVLDVRQRFPVTS